MARKSFSIHSDYYGVLSSLSTEQRGAVLLALISWAQDGELIELDQACAMLYQLMTAQIERISAANSSNGEKGGRGNKNEKSEAKPIKPTITVTDTVSVPVSDTKTNISLLTLSDKAHKTNKTDKTKYGKHSYVVLSAAEYDELLSEYGKDTLDRFIVAVDEWAEKNGNINKRTNWAALIRKAVKEGWSSGNTSAKRKVTKKNYDEDL